jgi:glycosyltransferase involved in cell wall biosynthesis
MRERRRQLKALSMSWLEWPILRGAAAVHFTSEIEAQEARGLGIVFKEAFVPLAVEFADSPHAEAPSRFADLRGSPCVLFLSRLDAKKNLENLLDAVAILKVELPSLRLLVAGDGVPDYVASLHARAGTLGISSQVVWAGHVEGAEKAAAFAAADIFALPSYSENFGIAAAEALASGLPCVLGQGVAIANDVVQAKAGVAVAPDSQAIAHALRRIISDQEGLARMSANASRLARERFSMQAMGVRLKQLYTDIVGQ